MASTDKIEAFLAEPRNIIVAGIRRDERPLWLAAAPGMAARGMLGMEGSPGGQLRSASLFVYGSRARDEAAQTAAGTLWLAVRRSRATASAVRQLEVG
jgi:hypothetical protein